MTDTVLPAQTPEETFGTGAAIATAPPRALMPDLIRAFALIGIVLVNVMGFSWGLESGYFDGGMFSTADRAADLTVGGLFVMKSYPLFSMMFGAGLYYQLASAERRGVSAGPRYARRIVGLFLLGFIHFAFFWMGDILMMYAVLGALLYAFKGFDTKTLWIIGWVLIIINATFFLLTSGMFYMFEAYDPAGYAEMQNETGLEFLGDETQIFTEGSFWDVSAYRAMMLPLGLIGGIMQQGIAVFGFFCFGLAAVKSGMIDTPTAPFWKRARWVFLPIGLTGSFIGAWLMQISGNFLSGTGMLGLGLIMAFSPFSALGYAGVIAKACEGTAGPVKRFLARAGSASLTAYLLQSVILSLVFTGYGLGYFAQLGAFWCIMIALATGIASLAFAGIWRGFAARGPMEVLLRRFTYWGRA